MNPRIKLTRGELGSIWFHCLDCKKCRKKLFEIAEDLDLQTDSDILELTNNESES